MGRLSIDRAKIKAVARLDGKYLIATSDPHLALPLIRVVERRTGMTWRCIATELGRVDAVALTGTAGNAVHTTPLTTTQAGILRDCQVPAPLRSPP